MNLRGLIQVNRRHTISVLAVVSVYGNDDTPVVCDRQRLLKNLASKFGYSLNHPSEKNSVNMRTLSLMLPTKPPTRAKRICQGGCARQPRGGKRRMVWDVGKESQTPDSGVDLLVDWHVSSQYSKRPPKLNMTSPAKVKETCNRMNPKWGQVCRDNLSKKEPYREPKWWSCELPSFFLLLAGRTHSDKS